MPFMSTFRNALPAAGAVALALALAGCMEEQVAGSTTTGNTGKGAISGRVVDAGGNGVPGARVRVVPVDHNPGPGGSDDIADVVTTGADGAFLTDSLPDGSYNLLSEKGDGFAFRDSVEVRSDTGTEVAGDTLKPPGSVKGVVRLQPGHDSRTVFLILPGTTTFAVPADSIGNFRLGNLAEGTYRLRLLSTLDAYQPVDTVITVTSDVETTLPDTLRLPYRPVSTGEVPVIDDVTLAYDTTAMAVTLRWGRRDPALVGSYHVYRRDQDSGYSRITAAPIAETTFVDDWTSGIRAGRTYHYAVTALDPRGNEGRKGEAAIFTMRVGYLVERLKQTKCLPVACHYDVGPEGHLWVYDNLATVTRSEGVRLLTQWLDTAGRGGAPRPLVVDEEQSVYILDTLAMRLRKLTQGGSELWRVPVEGAARSLSLHRVLDTLLVWDSFGKVMTRFGNDGRLLGQDTLLRRYQPPTVPSRLAYQVDIGFHTLVGGRDFERIEFHDREGNTLSTWSPEARGYLVGIARDEDGRWFLSWNTEVLDIYSAERVPLAVIFAGGSGPLRAYGGMVYMQPAGGDLVRITTGL